MDRSFRSERPFAASPVRAGRLAACVVLGVITGCSAGSTGPRTYPVKGTVTFDGAPVEQGTILFRRLEGDGRGYSGEITNGGYELQAEAGKMRVEITASRAIPGKFTEVNPGEKDPVFEMYVPKVYNAESTLEVDVTAGSNTHAFDLKP